MTRLTPLSLARRTLRHHLALTIALILGVALATAVITGALMVGDSVRGSLRDMALARLGPVDHAAIAVQPFAVDLVDRLRKSPGFPKGADAFPMLRLRGSASIPGHTRVPGVDIFAIAGPLDPTRAQAGQAVINDELAEVLNASDDVVFPITLTLPALDDAGGIARNSVLANRSRTELIAGDIKPRVSEIAREPGFASLFSFSPGQRSPRLAWVPLPELQEAIDATDQANTILLTHVPRDAILPALLKQVMTLEDYGLSFVPSQDNTHTQLTSRTIYLPPGVVSAANRAAAKLNIVPQHVSANLVNVLKNNRTGKVTHYTTAAGISALDDSTPIAPDEVVLNQWAASQLDAIPGDTFTLVYYQRDRNGNLFEVSSAPATPLKLARVLPMFGLAADHNLVPKFKGMSDVERVADWRPPLGLKIDQSLADEPYWDAHRASPKLFLNLQTAAGLWSDSPGQTGIRIPADKREAFVAALLAELTPEDVGLTIVPLKNLHLAAAAGSTDFSGLFIGFSFFLVAAAMIILGALFRLGIEQRSRQLGVLAAVGFSPRALAGLLLRETFLVALLGTLLGLLFALAYTAIMVHGLATWWIGATGTRYLSLHVEPITLAAGFFIAMILVHLTVLVSLRRVLKTQAARLVAGGLGPDRFHLRSRRRMLYATAAIALAAIAAVSIALGGAQKLSPQIAFLNAGLSLLIAGLSALRAWIEPGRGAKPLRTLGEFSLRSAGYRPGRAVLTASLIALASFTLVTVASMRQRPPADPRQRPSGTGGYALLLTADAPLMGDLNTATGRKILGLEHPDNPLLARATFTNLRSWQGQDVSCLNMTKPTQPTILELPQELRERFLWQKASGKPLRAHELTTRNPLVFADHETAEYILHLHHGDTLPITDQTGHPRQLQLAGTLPSSVFQSELLMDSAFFTALFPHVSGFSTVLIECPPEDEKLLAQLLESELADFSVSVESTAARLARYQKVANTYLSTFQALGSLGLLLGTMGMSIVLLRTVFERRAEIAILSATGFAPLRIFLAVFIENASLLAAGMVIGTASALLGVLPAAREINLGNLAFILVLILAIGLCVLFLTTRIALRKITPATLRAQ